MPERSADVASVLDRITESGLIGLASDLIRIPSFRPDETAIATWLGTYFTDRGYDVDLQEIDPGRFQTIATLKGTGGGQSLMFNGHLDIDPLANGWKRDPWTPSLEGDRLYGGGVANMKAGISSMINTVEAIRRSGVECKGDLVIAAVSGHGEGGYGTQHMLDAGVRADMAIVPEPYGSRTIVTTHCGIAQMAISTIGYAQHVQRRKYAVDAIKHMRRVIEVLEAMQFTCEPRADLPDLPILNVGGIIGGKGSDYSLSIPGNNADHCTILVDVRYLPGQTWDSVRADIAAALDRLREEEIPELHYEIDLPADRRYRLVRIPFHPTEVPTSEPIVQTVARYVEEETGQPPDPLGVPGPTAYTGNDSCHLWPAGIPCVVYGPGWIPGANSTAGEPDDSTSVREMLVVSRVMALTALELCNVPHDR